MPIASFALLVGLISAPTQAPAQTPGAAKVSGRVIASESGAPIVGARVTLVLAPPQRPQRVAPFARPAEAITDQDGRFAFDGLAAGSYSLDVQKTGYVTFPDMNGRHETIQVGAGQAVANIDVRLQRGAIIAGRVLDAAGQPLADVMVMALSRTTLGSQERYLPRSAPGQTNDIGEFRVAGLAPGDYIVAATPRGQSPFGAAGIAAPAETGSRTTQVMTYYPGARDEATAQTIHVSAAQTVDNVVFTILTAPAYRISGVVVDEAGSPVAGAMVTLTHDGRGGPFMGPQGNAQSRSDGTFIVPSVPAGTYRMMASIPVTMSSGGSGGGSMVTWSSTGSGGTAVTGGIVGGVTTAGGATTIARAQSMPQPTEVVVADADVNGVRVVVKR